MSGTRQELRLPPARWAAKVRADKRGPVVGFVGSDDRTHAEKGQRGGITKLAACGRVERYFPQCRASAEVAFIVNPKHKLCLACVSALEDEIRREE